MVDRKDIFEQMNDAVDLSERVAECAHCQETIETHLRAELAASKEKVKELESELANSRIAWDRAENLLSEANDRIEKMKAAWSHSKEFKGVIMLDDQYANAIDEALR